MFDKLFLQRTYADLVAPRLELHKVQSYSPYKANFRCHICGDSQTNRYRKRGFILENGGHLVYYCHNECGTIGFEKYLKDYQNDLYVQYRFDCIKMFKDDQRGDEEDEEYIETEKFCIDVDDIDLPLAETNRDAYRYLRDRRIPEKFLGDIYYTDYFYKFVNSKIANKFESRMEEKQDRRIVFPMRNENNDIIGVIGRSIDVNPEMRYLTIKFDETAPKIFGLDRLNRLQTARVVEGPIDSFFVDNCIALAGTDGRPQDVFASPNDYVMILDNQPRSKSVLMKYEKYMEQGCQIMIWPDNVEGKDINDLILEGYTTQDIDQMIRLNTFSGLKLKIMFNKWRKYEFKTFSKGSKSYAGKW